MANILWDSCENQTSLSNWINTEKYPLHDPRCAIDLKQTLDQFGVVTLPNFLLDSARVELVAEAKEQAHLAYYTKSTHNVYLTPRDESLPENHIHNRQINSSKGCITTDQIPNESILLKLYHDPTFKEFLAKILDVESLHSYADPLSSLNVHYYSKEGQELGWHFDNSAFAITLLLQPSESGGGVFEYVPNLRDSSANEMNYSGVERILNGRGPHAPNKNYGTNSSSSTSDTDVTDEVKVLDIQPGTLVLFRGRDSLHRVTPTVKGSQQTRILVVFAYNEKPGISLSEEARMTFFGRTH